MQKRGSMEHSRKEWFPGNQVQWNVLDHARKIRGCYVLWFMEDWNVLVSICGFFCCYVLLCIEDWKNICMYLWLDFQVTLSRGCAEEMFPSAKIPQI